MKRWLLVLALASCVPQQYKTGLHELETGVQIEGLPLTVEYRGAMLEKRLDVVLGVKQGKVHAYAECYHDCRKAIDAAYLVQREIDDRDVETIRIFADWEGEKYRMSSIEAFGRVVEFD